MICKNCGSEIDNKQKVCPKCGELLGKETKEKNSKEAKIKTINNTIVYCIMGFVFPILGILVYIIGSKKGLIKSKSILIASILGLLFQIFI